MLKLGKITSLLRELVLLPQQWWQTLKCSAGPSGLKVGLVPASWCSVLEGFLLPVWRAHGLAQVHMWQGDVDLGVKTPFLFPFEEDAQDCRAALCSWEPDAFLSGL